MTIERNQVYKMDCIKGLQEMLQGGGCRQTALLPTRLTL